MINTTNIPTQEQALALAESDQYLKAAKSLVDGGQDFDGPYYFSENIESVDDVGEFVVSEEHWDRSTTIEEWIEGWVPLFRGEIDDETFEMQTEALIWAIKLELTKRRFEYQLGKIASNESRNYKFKEN